MVKAKLNQRTDWIRALLNAMGGRVLAGTGVLAVLAAAGCTSSVIELTPASILLSQTSVTFTVPYGAPNPPPQSFQIGNGGEEELSGLRVDVPQGWLTVSLSSTRAPTTVTIWVNVSGLPVGRHEQLVEIHSDQPGIGTQRVTVTLEITAAPPSAVTGAATGVTSSAATLNGTVNPNGFATSASFEWGTSSTLTGASTTPQQSVGSGTAALPTSAALSGLAPLTTYYFRAVASGPGGTVRGSIASFTTLPPASIMLSATSVAFTAEQGGSNPSPKQIQVTNGGQGALTALSASVGSGADWLSASLGGTTAPATLTLAVDIGGLGLGSYATTVQVSSPVAGNSPQSIAVTLEITVEKPIVTTGPATEVTASSATVTGSVNPKGSATQAWFEYGTSSSLAGFSSTPEQPVGSGGAAVSIGAGLSDLDLGTTYYYRAAARNAGGTERGSILSFTTDDPPLIDLSETRLTFTVDNRSGETSPQSVEITNGGGGTLTDLQATVLGQVFWLGVELSSDTAPAELWVYVGGSNLGPGTYKATIEVSSRVAENSPRTISVELNVVQAGEDLAAAPFVTDASPVRAREWTYLGDARQGSSSGGWAPPVLAFIQERLLPVHGVHPASKPAARVDGRRDEEEQVDSARAFRSDASDTRLVRKPHRGGRASAADSGGSGYRGFDHRSVADVAAHGAEPEW